MNNEELKDALFGGYPVMVNLPQYGEIEYKCVSHIIYGVENGKLRITAEVLDKNRNSVTIVDPKYIRKKGA